MRSRKDTPMRQRALETLRSTLEYFELPPYLENALRWVERHPRTVLAGTGALVVLLTVALSQTPAESPAEQDAYNGEVPLFV
ncbi:hypothetical protein MYX77_05970 [Acidobacteriia bacterium AH_259_A11_L15]|nr:hypothetical protein [Acidobacteriia bacterium AH_259_A11_L15]